MRLPLGLDLKSLVAGALIAYFVVPWIMGMLASRKSNSAAQA